MENQKNVIGKATISYDKDGKVIHASFEPTMTVNLDEGSMQELEKIECSDVEIIKKNAEIIIAAWFNKVTEIELADRTKFQIVSNIESCTKHMDTDKVETCIIIFSLQSL